jgi:hypothetical protein
VFVVACFAEVDDVSGLELGLGLGSVVRGWVLWKLLVVVFIEINTKQEREEDISLGRTM